MYKPSYRIVMSGSRFSPAAVVSQTGLELSDAQEPDSIATSGRNKGRPRGYGSAALETRPDLTEPQSLHELLVRFEKHATQLRDQGAEEEDGTVSASDRAIYFDAAIYWKDQCNLAYDADVLLKMGQLGLSFWLSCYEDSDP
jgi:hypothetical protein